MKNRSGRSGRNFGPVAGTTLRRAVLHRALRGESLEARHMMAGDVYLPFHNDLIPEDTNGDYTVSALDALLVINAINTGQSGELVGPGIGKADGPLLDVSGDNSLSALDALRIVDRINGEGEDPPIVGFRFELTDQLGNVLPNNSASVGQVVQLKTYVKDLRAFAAGVYAAFLDVDYSNSDKFQVNVGEVQSFRYDLDKLSTTDPNSSFKFMYDTGSGIQTTAPVSVFEVNEGAGIQAALEALPGIGVGNVIVRKDVVGSSQDEAAGRLRDSYDIIFVNNMAGKNVALLTLDASNVKLQPNSTFVFTLQDKLPADPSNSASVAAAFQFASEFPNSPSVSLGVNKFEEVGAVREGTGRPPNPRLERFFFSVPLKTVAPGLVTFTPNAAEIFPAHETLVFPSNVVPPNLIDYGAPFSLVITSSITANNDNFTVVEDASTAEFNVTTNDSISSGTSFVISSVAASAAGVTPTISVDGKKVNYRPTANFFGSDTFTYTITSNLGASTTATVTMTVTPVNDPVSVPSQSVSTRVNTPKTFSTSDLTVNGDVGPGESTIQQLRISSVTSPTAKGGTVSLSGGSVTYTPVANSGTSDTFTIVVTDDGQTNGTPAPSARTVTVNVALLNDAPVATNDIIDTVDEDTTNNTLNVLANDSPGANDTNDRLVIIATGGTPNGAVSIAANGLTLIYTPKADTLGEDTFTYTVRDLAGATATATVIVDVQATILPRARADAGVTVEDSGTGVLIDVLSNDRISDQATKVLLSVNAPANGTAVIEAGQVRYKPNAQFSGVDVFTYVMNQSPTPGLDSIGTVTVNVAAVNDVPVLVNDTVTANEDQTLTISPSTLLGNDSPGLGETQQQTLALTSVQSVTVGGGSVVVSGANVIYTPAPNFNDVFVFTYTATDTGSPALSSTATVTVNINDVNDAPIVGNDTSSTAEDSPVTIQATVLGANDLPGPASATDESGQSIPIVSVSPSSAQGGTVTLAAGGGSVTYTPALNFFGSDTFTYTVRDSGTPALEATATVTVNVSAVNDAPVVVADTVTAFKGVPLTIAGSTLLANDRPGPANENNQTLTITQVSGATNGTVALGSNGQIVFTPNDGFTGPASFTYTLTDNGQTNDVADPRTATGTVSVTVQEFIPSSISGTVYVDDSRDGVINSAERRLGGVTVSLVGTALGQSISQSVITLGDGTYQFEQLAPGSYTISFVNPALMINGIDTPGSLGDTDGIQNNNSFTLNVTSPGGIDAGGYNFAVNGIVSDYGALMEKLASRFYAAGSTLANFGMYFTINSAGEQTSFAKLDGFDDIVFAEATMINSGTQVLVSIVDKAHDVFTAVLGKGKFLTNHDGLGNTIIRILGGREQLNFTKVNTSSPAIARSGLYLDAVDTIFSQQGW